MCTRFKRVRLQKPSCIHIGLLFISLVNIFECQTPLPLGMERGGIADQQISASTQWDAAHASSQGRLRFKKTNTKQGGWSSLTVDTSQWLQIDLGNHQTRVTRVATQGRNSNQFYQWVTKYKLLYSDDGNTFHYYSEQGKPKVLLFILKQDAFLCLICRVALRA